MREQEFFQQNQTQKQERVSRKQKLEKKRMIRKNKIQPNLIQYGDLKKIDTSTLSREEKARIQKAKNREAAQKSRDTHKQYVSSLEKQIKELRERQNNSRKICWKCQKQFEEASNHESSSSEQQTEERTKPQKIFNFEGEQEKDFSSMDHFQHFDQESFMRAEDSGQISYMKMMIFVCMIVVALMWVSSTNLSETGSSIESSRALMQLPEIAEQTPKEIPEIIEKNISKNAIVPVQKGLIPMNSDCLNSLMAINSQQSQKRSLRTYRDSSSPPNYLAHQDGILLCTVRTSKTYKSNYEKLRSPLVKLYLLGSQIKQMLTNSNLLIPIRDSSIQINGLYRVAAEIKDVNLVNDHKCLL